MVTQVFSTAQTRDIQGYHLLSMEHDRPKNTEVVRALLLMGLIAKGPT